MRDPVKTVYNKKQTAYRLTFGGEVAKDVLADLRTFCFATKPTFSNEGDGIARALEMARREGRKETFDRIMTFLKVDYDAIYDMNEDIYD